MDKVPTHTIGLPVPYQQTITRYILNRAQVHPILLSSFREALSILGKNLLSDWASSSNTLQGWCRVLEVFRAAE